MTFIIGLLEEGEEGTEENSNSVSRNAKLLLVSWHFTRKHQSNEPITTRDIYTCISILYFGLIKKEKQGFSCECGSERRRPSRTSRRAPQPHRCHLSWMPGCFYLMLSHARWSGSGGRLTSSSRPLLLLLLFNSFIN